MSPEEKNILNLFEETEEIGSEMKSHLFASVMLFTLSLSLVKTFDWFSLTIIESLQISITLLAAGSLGGLIGSFKKFQMMEKKDEYAHAIFVSLSGGREIKAAFPEKIMRDVAAIKEAIREKKAIRVCFLSGKIVKTEESV